MSLRVLVVGVQPDSLGEAIMYACSEQGFACKSAGIKGEGVALDVHDSMDRLVGILIRERPDHIVVTVGINFPKPEFTSYREWYASHMETNAIGPMKLLEAWRLSRIGTILGAGHFVAISSNSAHIARTQSAAYCASKAALSMAIRCEARELSRKHAGIVAYGYEPGLLTGTPMTQEVARRVIDGATDAAGRVFPKLHRMPGVHSDEGIAPSRLANMIAANIRNGQHELSGCMIRIDAGEQ